MSIFKRKAKKSQLDKRMIPEDKYMEIEIDEENHLLDNGIILCDVIKMAVEPFQEFSQNNLCKDYFYDFDLSEEKNGYLLSISISGENNKKVISAFYSQFQIIPGDNVNEFKLEDILKNKVMRMKIDSFIQVIKEIINFRFGNMFEKVKQGEAKYVYGQISEIKYIMGDHFDVEDLKKEPNVVKNALISENCITKIDELIGYQHQPDNQDDMNSISMIIVNGFALYETDELMLKIPNTYLGKEIEHYYVEYAKKIFNEIEKMGKNNEKF